MRKWLRASLQDKRGSAPAGAFEQKQDTYRNTQEENTTSKGTEYILELKQVIKSGKTEKVVSREWALDEEDFERFELMFEEDELLDIDDDVSGWTLKLTNP